MSSLSPDPADAPPEPEPCWRCGKVGDPDAGICKFCRARLWSDPAADATVAARAGEGTHPLLKVFAAYSVMLLFSLIWGLVLHFHDQLNRDQHLAGTAFLEGLDTALVMIAALAVGRLVIPKPRLGARVVAWLLGPFALAFVLAANVAYHWVLSQFLRPGWLRGAFAPPAWSTVTLLLFALQPALVEEWFFRHLALGAVRSATGLHTAVWVSAIMFALAHVYNPLGLPWLLLAGVVFGYAKVASGGLGLPVLLHFAHNATILWFREFT